MMRVVYIFLILVIFSVSSLPFNALAQNVNFPDANLAAAVRQALSLEEDADIPLTSLQGLDTLFANSAEITDLTGLENASALIALHLRGNPTIRDFTPLTNLTNLKVLNLIETGFSNSDFSVIQRLTNLTGLFLGFNEITDITNLPQLPNLKTLHMESNQIRDISRIIDALDPTKIVEFAFTSNQIRDITPLSGFTNVTALYLAENRITDVTPIGNLTKLRSRLRLFRNEIRDISPLSTLIELRDLWFYSNEVSDLSPLSTLTELRTLVICYNPYTDIRPLANLNNLRTLYIDEAFVAAYRALVPEMTTTTVLGCVASPEPEPTPEPELEPELEPEPKVKRRRYLARCGLGWTPHAQYQHHGELPKVMIYALEFEYDTTGHGRYICKTIEIRTGEDSIENLAGWKLYLGTLYNPSIRPMTIPEEYSHVRDRILRVTPEMFGLETFPCNTVNGISHPLPGVHYVLKTDENVLVDTAYSCFIWGQSAWTPVDGVNVKSQRSVSSAALRGMDPPRLERYLMDPNSIYITYMPLDEFTWDRAVLSDWLLPPSESLSPGAPSVIPRKLGTTWGALKK